jgi:tetratricopeptide (TPR) repeat protein
MATSVYNLYGYVNIFVLLFTTKPMNQIKTTSSKKESPILKTALVIIALAFVGIGLLSHLRNTDVSYDVLTKGIEYYKNGKDDEALQEIMKAIKINPKNAEAYCMLGNVYDNKGDTKQSIVAFNKAVEIKPNLTEAYYNRGNVYRKMGDFDQAISDYTKAIQITMLMLIITERAPIMTKAGLIKLSSIAQKP